MKKIGTLTCLKSNHICARVSCLNAFNNRTGYFQDYPEDTQLVAMMTCNGCKVSSETDPSEDKRIMEKIRRLKYEGVEKVHVGVCVMIQDGGECRHITTIRKMLEEEGIPTVDGTHFTSKRKQSQ